MKIYYLIPNLYIKKTFSIKGFLSSLSKRKVKKYIHNCFFIKPKPVGGIKVIYQHCILLNSLGYETYPVLMGEYHGNFYNYDIEYKEYNEVIHEIGSSDVVVATEFEPYQGLQFENARKVMFIQNWLGLTTRLDEDDLNKSYINLGYDHVITCSNYCTQYVKQKMDIHATTITNGIDLTQFHPSKEHRRKNRILAMSRKNPDDLQKIMALMAKSNYEFRIVDGLSQAELITEYQAADIFLATGYPEGFGLPPLEAMCCGCVVVGFTGGGAREFMRDGDTALIAEDGDVYAVVAQLNLLENDENLKETIRENGLKNAQQYDLSVTRQQLQSFYHKLDK